MGSNKRIIRSLLDPRAFGLILGLIVFGAFVLLGEYTDVFSNMETRVMDLHFNLKQSLVRESTQENVVTERRSHQISDDIILIGIDNKTLDAFGRWPFPRSHHADLLNSFTRIQKQSDRESVILLDVLFNDIADRAFEDVVLLDAMEQNGNIALQPQLFHLPLSSAREVENKKRLDALLGSYGEIPLVKGDVSEVNAYYGIESPLTPYGRNISAYGHASFQQDHDKTYRRQQLVSRFSERIGEYPLDEITLEMDFAIGTHGHLAWVNDEGVYESVELPLDEDSLAVLHKGVMKNGLPRVEQDDEGNETRTYYIYSFRDHYIPAISLTLALEYFNKSLDDVEVEYGSHILIPSPMRWDPDAEMWVPYAIPQGAGGRKGMQTLEEIRIPIDKNGNMLINFMGRRSSPEAGGLQTFPVRSYSAYASSAKGPDTETWPTTKKLGGKILMVGAFTLGMADDEKTTPLGLMFGVEMHANSVNTIVMNNFISRPEAWVSMLVMLLLILFFAYLTSRMNNLGWSVGIILVFIAVTFLATTLIFEYKNLHLDWATPILAVLSTFVLVVIYRVLTAERDKRQIKNVFGQFISPSIVEELTESPPELGGEDVDVTVFFSDIRAFSRMSERLTAQELVSLLNEYLTDMTDNIVDAFQGTLDKYIGDAIMAFWGAPQPQEDHAVRACKSALMQISLLDSLNLRLSERAAGEEGTESIEIGIGVNSGTCMVGYMGSEGRKNYTAMGDTVNLASRLEGVNKTYKTHILISEDTREQIKHEPFILRELDMIRVKGRLKPVTIYELVDYDGELGFSVKEATDSRRG